MSWPRGSAGRRPQCPQRVSAWRPARTRPSTAVNGIRSGSMPARGPRGRGRRRSCCGPGDAQASCRAGAWTCRAGRGTGRGGFSSGRGTPIQFAIFRRENGDSLAGCFSWTSRVVGSRQVLVLAPRRRVQVTMVTGPRGGRVGSRAAVLSPVSRPRSARMPSDSSSVTAPSRRAGSSASGPGRTCAFLTRAHGCARWRRTAGAGPWRSSRGRRG